MQSQTYSPVVESVQIARRGTRDEVIAWLSKTGRCIDIPPHVRYRRYGGEIYDFQIDAAWIDRAPHLDRLANLFIGFARTEGRIQESDPAQHIAPADTPSHPLHNVIGDDSIEGTLSESFKSAFGKELVLNWRAGQQFPLHVGPRPKTSGSVDRVSNEYVQKVFQLPALSTQGDGMRSFVTLLLYCFALDAPVLLIDEPEAFLHPPQSRLAGATLARATRGSRQVFAATHSKDVIHGALSENPNARVVRLTRKENVTSVHIVSPAAVQALWKDPLLRYSNAIDGLFHDVVVICEGDADCKFYEAMFLALEKQAERTSPDVLFTFVSGKSRLGTLKQALNAVGVRAIAICDFDAIREDKPLNELVDPATWHVMKPKLRQIRSALDTKLPSILRAELGSRIATVISKGQNQALSDSERDEIKDLLRGTSVWTMAKDLGLRILPSGTVSAAGKELVSSFMKCDVAIVPIGQLESFCRQASSQHGPAWVEAVMQRDLLLDPDLSEARDFMHSVSELIHGRSLKRPA